MTDTTNTVDTAEVDANMGASAGQAIGSLEHLDPNVLQIGENVRDAVDLGKEFLASLARARRARTHHSGARRGRDRHGAQRPAPHARCP